MRYSSVPGRSLKVGAKCTSPTSRNRKTRFASFVPSADRTQVATPILLFYQCLDNFGILDIQAIVKIPEDQDHIVRATLVRVDVEAFPYLGQIVVAAFGLLLMSGQVAV